MKKNILIMLGLLCALAAGVAGFLFQESRQQQDAQESITKEIPARPPGAETGDQRPDFSLHDMEGNLRSVSEWDGKVLVINFWATWCPPCRKEIPEFVKLQDKYGAQGLQFAGIALHTAEEVRDFAAELKMNYPVLVGLEEVIRIAEQYGNRTGMLPYTVIIDRQQRIAFIKHGPLSYEEAEAEITPLL